MTRTDRGLLALVALSALILALFATWPGIDLWLSARFFDGARFPGATDPGLTVLRWLLRVSPFLPTLAGLYLLLAPRGRRPWLGLDRRGWVIVSFTFLLGPGLMANLLLKRFWGRARPRQVEEFGGPLQFTPPHDWTDQCAANCSFVSGEVAGAAALAVAIVVLARASRARLGKGGTRALYALAALAPVAAGYQRIAAGAHFLSDALLATTFTLMIALLLHRFLPPSGR
jgi:lipid A 4'-phosphatase